MLDFPLSLNVALSLMGDMYWLIRELSTSKVGSFAPFTFFSSLFFVYLTFYLCHYLNQHCRWSLGEGFNEVSFHEPVLKRTYKHLLFGMDRLGSRFVAGVFGYGKCYLPSLGYNA